MSDLMMRDPFFFFRVQQAIFLLQAADDALHCFLQFGQPHRVFPAPRRQQRRLIDDIGQVSAHEPRGHGRADVQIGLGRQCHPTRAAPTPTNISTNSDPLMEKNGTPASPATALASRVFPVPGGPTNRIPLGILPPSRRNFSGVFRNSMTSRSSSLASSTPAASAKVTLTSFSM